MSAKRFEFKDKNIRLIPSVFKTCTHKLISPTLFFCLSFQNLLHSDAAPLPEYKTQAVKKSRFILSHYGIFKGCWDWLILGNVTQHVSEHVSTSVLLSSLLSLQLQHFTWLWWFLLMLLFLKLIKLLWCLMWLLRRFLFLVCVSKRYETEYF